MQFNVEEDTGQITMWIVPSNPVSVPSVAVTLGDQPPVIVGANVFRDDLRSYGLHATGNCGFVITEALVPGIETAPRVELREFDTDLLIYRRDTASTYIEGRLFRLETSVRRLAEIDIAFEPNFHMAYFGLESLSAETAKNVLRTPYTLSMYASGRLPLQAIDDVLRRHNFKVAVLIRDPVVEMLDRLQILSEPDENSATIASLMPAAITDRIIRSLAGIDLRRLDQLGKAIEHIDTEALTYLSDPLTRILIEANPSQPLPRDSAQKAVLRLAEIDIVSHENDIAGFFELAGAVLEFEPRFSPPVIVDRGVRIEAVLRKQPWFTRLIRYDLAVFDATIEAAASVRTLHTGVAN